MLKFKNIISTVLVGLLGFLLTPQFTSASDVDQGVKGELEQPVPKDDGLFGQISIAGTPVQFEYPNVNVFDLAKALDALTVGLNNTLKYQNEMDVLRSRRLENLIENLVDEVKVSIRGNLDLMRQEIKEEIQILRKDLMKEINNLKPFWESFLHNQTLSCGPMSPETKAKIPASNQTQDLGTVIEDNTTVSPNAHDSDGGPIVPDQNIIHVITTEGLHEALTNLVEGSVIQLAEGIYIGQFTISEADIVVRGEGKGTIIKLDDKGMTENRVALNISGDNCQVHSLKIVSNFNRTTGILINGSGTEVTDVHLQGFEIGVKTLSDGNSFHNVTVKSCRTAFDIVSNNNSLHQILIEDTTTWAVYFKGNNNSLSHMNCYQCRHSFLVEGNDNHMEYVSQQNSPDLRFYWGVVIPRGTRNRLDFYSTNGAGVVLQSDTSSAEIRNVISTQVGIDGTGHHLLNVDAGSWLYVGGSGHRIEKSKAERLNDQGLNVTLIDSKFDFI